MQRAWQVVHGVACAAMVAACGSNPKPVVSTVERPPSERPPTRHIIDENDGDENTDMQLTSSRGTMDPAAIEKAMAGHTTAIADCYTEQVGTRRWLGGEVKLHWRIDGNGRLTSVALGDGDLGAWPIEKCMLEIARAIAFPKPKGGKAEFTVPLQFSAKGKAVVWDADRSLAAIGGQTKKLEECRKLAQLPAMSDGDDATTIAITLYVGPGGKAHSVGFATTAGLPPADGWFDCVEKIALGWRLPDPRGQYSKLAISVDAATSKISTR
ncbi:MAG: AgmX/PglI C-terminal domain-containing protein [Kofleriaceae bacterium]|nr:AgmX/PglI C-terminal domain-containing protein [Kofleriaceae bacterium]